MKKAFLLALGLGGYLYHANAQVTIAPEIGLNAANVNYDMSFGGATVSPKTKILPGLRAGVNFQLPITSSFYIEPGVFYTMRGTNYTYVNNLLNTTYDLKSTTHNLEIPINLGLKIDVGVGDVFFTAGPYIGIGMGGTDKGTVTSPLGATSSEKDIEFGDDGDLKMVDVGMNISAGFGFKRGLYVRGYYNQGFNNLATNSNATYINNGLGIALGFKL